MLYDLHDKPESLNHHEKLKTHHPGVVWEEIERVCRTKKIFESKAKLKLFKAYEHLWAKSPRYALDYAYMKGKPFPEGEPAIAKDAAFSHLYAANLLKGRFPLGEPTIAKDATRSYGYATYTLKGPFLAGEPAIAKDAEYCKLYLDSFPERKQAIQELQKSMGV